MTLSNDLLSTGFEQERDFEQERWRIAVFDDEARAFVVDRRVDERLQRRKLAGIAEHLFRQGFAIDSVGAGGAREAILDALDQRSARALQPADDGIGVEHRDPGFAEHRRDRRFAHSDGPGERKADHVASSPRERSSPRSGTSGIPRMVK